jgi:hypothetical protein
MREHPAKLGTKIGIKVGIKSKGLEIWYPINIVIPLAAKERERKGKNPNGQGREGYQPTLPPNFSGASPVYRSDQQTGA